MGGLGGKEREGEGVGTIVRWRMIRGLSERRTQHFFSGRNHSFDSTKLTIDL